MADVRLNAWAISWDIHALHSQPSRPFDANSFYPAPHSLLGSEHLFGVAAQVLPFASFVQSAAGTYNLALALSFALLALTMFALVYWITGDSLAALLSALLAALAPWRFSDLSHLQLLSMQWIPLVWLLLGRRGEGTFHRRSGVLLAGVILLQLMSCYYLAYYLTFGLGVALPVLFAARATDRRALARSLPWVLTAYAAFVLLSLPYLVRSAQGELSGASFAWPIDVSSIWLALTSDETVPVVGKRYSMPAAALVLAAVSLWNLIAQNGTGRRRSWTTILWITGLGAAIFALGPTRTGWDDPLRMPNRILELFIPGFAHLRVPTRWLLLTDTCVAATSGIGLATLGQWLHSGAARLPASEAVARLVQAVVAGLAIYSVYPGPLPIVDAFVWPRGADAAYSALASLPREATVELPYRGMEGDSHYLLASTRHWQPLLNGYTGYPPPTYEFLMSLAYNLPDARRLRALTSLTGLRWIILHKTPEVDVSAWDAAVRDGSLAVVHDDPGARILEVTDRRDAGARLGWLLDRDPRGTTLDGADRGELHLDSSSGRILAPAAGRIGRFGDVALTLQNDSDTVWPGADYRRDGLIEVAYRYLPPDGISDAPFASVPLFEDVAPHESKRMVVFLKWPGNPDSFHGSLELRLGQRFGGELRLLDIPATVVPYVPTRNTAPR